MRQLLYVTLVFLSGILGQCNFPSPIGEDIVQNEVLDVVFIDTVNLQLSTVQLDSIVTSNTNRHLIGHHEDAALGSTTACPFFRISNDSLTLPDEDAEYLYTEFELFYDGYFYYDTTQDVTIGLYRLTEALELDEDDDVLYNSSAFPYDSEAPLGQLTFAPRPGRTTSVSIPVNDEFGKALFDFADPEEAELFYDEFEDRYPGLVLVPDTTSTQSFLGFTPQSRLVIHYRVEGEEEEIVFPTNGLRYNRITSDRTGTPLEPLVTLETDISSTATNNRSYLRNGVGNAIKVEIPSLDEIREVLTQNFITEATLVLRPVRDTYGDLTPFPAEITVFEVDRFNRRRRVVNVTQSLIVDDEFGENTEYRIELTNFIQDKIAEDERNEDAILLQGSEATLGTTVDRLVVGDRFSEFEATLELFVLDYIVDIE